MRFFDKYFLFSIIIEIMKTFILLSAVPGAGKSTWALQYQMTHPHVYIVSSDDIRKELTGVYQNWDKEQEVWDLYFKRIIEYRDLFDDVTVIADSTNIQNKFRLFYGQNVTGFDKKCLIILDRPLDIVFKQNLERSSDKIVPEDVIKSMHDRFEIPTQEVIDSYDEFITIHKWKKLPGIGEN